MKQDYILSTFSSVGDRDPIRQAPLLLLGDLHSSSFQQKLDQQKNRTKQDSNMMNSSIMKLVTGLVSGHY